MKNAYHGSARSGGYGRTGGKKSGYHGPSDRGRGSFGAPRGRDFRGGDDRFDRPRLHDATCAGCGRSCQVPFKPNGSKPVFCRDCFKKDGANEAPARFAKRPSYGATRRDDSSEERPRAAVAAGADLSKLEARMASIERKLDLLIESVTVEEDLEDEEGK